MVKVIKVNFCARDSRSFNAILYFCVHFRRIREILAEKIFKVIAISYTVYYSLIMSQAVVV